MPNFLNISGLLRSFGIGWSSFILDVSNVSTISTHSVGHSLNTTIRESHLIGSRDDLSIRGFFGRKVIS
uniref:Uncharacterized protein n=1 Tax=Lepeophtheirus salmonis TaxID=72036 RepID=A0A0K2T3R3_LEPSM